MDLFRNRGVQQALSNPWGRSFRAGSKACQPQAADSFQFFAKVIRSDLRAVLQQSGFNGVYVVPRGWDRQLLPGWSVVWMPGAKADVEKQALLVPEQHGLVRSRSKFGLRVPTDAFARIFEQLRPGTKAPEALEVRGLYKTGPFPHAVSAEDVQDWARQLAWPVRVVKALGPQFWLLGAPTDPPAATALFNAQPVLIKQVQNRDAAPPVLQAGGPVPAQTRRATAHADAEVDPWLHSDPWSSYRAGSTAAASKTKPKPTARPHGRSTACGPCAPTGNKACAA